MVIQSGPGLMLRVVQKWPGGFNLGYLEKQPDTGKKGKYDKYFTEIEPSAMAIPLSHEGKVAPLAFYDYYDNKEYDRTIDLRMIQGADIGFGIGEPTRDPMFEFAQLPHKHAFQECYHFMGIDKDNPQDLGGTVEFWIGEGSEAEKYEITKPTSILIPKNTIHLPAYVTEWHKPFLMLSVLDAPIWSAAWSQSFPSDFKHVKV